MYIRTIVSVPLHFHFLPLSLVSPSVSVWHVCSGFYPFILLERHFDWRLWHDILFLFHLFLSVCLTDYFFSVTFCPPLPCHSLPLILWWLYDSGSDCGRYSSQNGNLISPFTVVVVGIFCTMFCVLCQYDLCISSDDYSKYFLHQRQAVECRHHFPSSCLPPFCIVFSASIHLLPSVWLWSFFTFLWCDVFFIVNEREMRNQVKETTQYPILKGKRRHLWLCTQSHLRWLHAHKSELFSMFRFPTNRQDRKATKTSIFHV